MWLLVAVWVVAGEGKVNTAAAALSCTNTSLPIILQVTWWTARLLCRSVLWLPVVHAQYARLAEQAAEQAFLCARLARQA